MKLRAKTALRLPAGTRMRLTDSQAAARQHLGWTTVDGWAVCDATVEFKAGEIIETDGMPKDVVASVEALGAQPEADGDSGLECDEPPASVPEISTAEGSDEEAASVAAAAETAADPAAPAVKRTKR